jgi:hypothetical protein
VILEVEFQCKRIFWASIKLALHTRLLKCDPPISLKTDVSAGDDGLQRNLQALFNQGTKKLNKYTTIQRKKDIAGTCDA